LKSRPFTPHEIFISFIDAAIKNKKLNSWKIKLLKLKN
jgi:hypothetical protein